MRQEDKSINDEINLLKSVTTEKQADQILDERIELIASDPEHSDIPEFMRMDAAKFTIQSVVEAFIKGEDKERLYDLFRLDRSCSSEAMNAGVSSALAVMGERYQKDDKTTKHPDGDGTIVKRFAPLVNIKTQKEADEFLEDFKKQFSHPVLAKVIAGKDPNPFALFSIQSAVESFIRSEDQRKLLYQLFNFDVSRRAEAIQRGRFAMSVISSRSSL